MGAAWIAAVAAVLVAVIGVTGNLIGRRKANPDDDALEADLNIFRALSAACEAEHDRYEAEHKLRIDLERRLAACEGREQGREH